MEFKNGKRYVVIAPAWCVMKNRSDYEKLERVFLEKRDILTYKSGKLYNEKGYFIEIQDTDNATYFEPYYTENEIKRYKESIEKFAPLILQGILDHEDLMYITNTDVQNDDKLHYLKRTSEAAYLFARSLADKLRNEEII